MRRRDISTALFASVAGTVALPQSPAAQTPAVSWYARTPAEVQAGVTPTNANFPPGQVDRYFANTVPGSTDASKGFAQAIAQAKQVNGNHVPIGAPIAVNGSLAIAGTVTIPAAVYENGNLAAAAVLLQIISGSIHIEKGALLQIHGSFSAPRIACFEGAGDVAFGGGTIDGAGSTLEACPEWWGARGDSMPGPQGTIATAGTLCTTAIKRCLVAAQGGPAGVGGLIPVRFGPGYYLTGPQTIPPATTMRGAGREQSGFIAAPGTSGVWWQETSAGAAKIIIEDLAFYGAYAASPKMTFALRLGYVKPSSPHGTEGYLRGLWIRGCACYSYGFQCDISGNVGFYDLLSIYGDNLFQQSGLRILGTANMCSKLATIAAGSPIAPLWSSSTGYAAGDFASRDSSNYLCILANTDHSPPNPAYWVLYRQGSTYGIYLNGPGIQMHGMEIEAPGSGSIALSIQNNTDINGVVFALADGTILDHVWELGVSAKTWKLTGVTYVHGRANNAVIKHGNGKRADGSYFAGNATGNGVPWSSAARYIVGQIVNHAGAAYTCIDANSGEMPPNAGYWKPYIADINDPPQQSGQGNWFSDTNGQRLQSFTVRISNIGGVLSHRISEPAGTTTNFASEIVGATATYTPTPVGTDGSTAFAAGGKIGSAHPSVFWLATQNQSIADTVGLAFVSYNTTGTALNVISAIASAEINGVSRNRLQFRLTEAASGADFALNAANIASGKVLQISWLGSLSS